MIVANSAASTNLKSPLVPLIRQQRNRLQRTSWYQSASQRHSLHSSSIHHPPPSPTRLVPLIIVQHLQAKISLFNSPKLIAPNAEPRTSPHPFPAHSLEPASVGSGQGRGFRAVFQSPRMAVIAPPRESS